LFDLFRPRVAEASVSRDASDDRIWSSGAGRSSIGVTVTLDRANQVPVVRDCRQVISTSIAGLEFGAFRRTGPGQTERLPQHPIVALMTDPNARDTSYDFMAHVVDDLISAGDYFAEIVSDSRGQVAELRRMDPLRVMVDETREGTKRFHYTDRHGRSRVLLEGEVWHVPLPPLIDDLRGRSPILHDGVEAVAVAIALQRYANNLFTNDATPPFVFKMAAGQEFDTAVDRQNFLKAWWRKIAGSNRGRPGILENGIEIEKLGITAEEAQFLETRRELWLDLTRLWRMPPHKVGIMDKATFSNIEHQALEFVTDTLRPIIELIERSIKKFLIADPDVFFEFNVESLLRGDIKTRFEAYAIGRQWGWLSVNDVCAMERRNGIGPAGDRYMEPLNMVPVGTDGDRSVEAQASVAQSVAFLKQSVARRGGRPRLELVKDAA
jgi:HK97 family phage portal protein